MRRFAGPVLLSLLSGCYLFSDAPKARKTADNERAAAKPQTDPAPAPRSAAEPATPDGKVADCPEFLTGVEAKARTIASSCGPVRVRGQYRIDGGTLTLEPGVELRFEQNAVLEVGRDRPGVLTVLGTPAQPVRLVADQIGETGRWQGVRLHAQSTGSTLTQIEIASAGTEAEAALWIAADEVTIEGLTIRGATTLGLEIVAERGPSMLGLDLSGTGVVARVSPGAAAKLHDLKLEPTAFVAIASGKIANTIEWPPNRYRIEGVIRIEGHAQRPASLTLAPGASLYFTPAARLLIGGFGPGSLNASANPRTRADPALANPELPDETIRLLAAEDSRPGSWSGIHVQDQGQLILRNVELAYGGSRDEGVVIADGSATLSLEGCLFRDNLVGLELRGNAVTLASFTANEFTNTPVALRTTPTLLGSVAADNRYDEHARIDVTRGKIESDATWSRQAAPIQIHGDVFVDKGATLTVAPGSRLGFDPGVVLGVGYYEQATLDMRGTAEAPIILEPTSPPKPVADPVADPNAAPQADAKPSPWGGVVLGTHARDTRFEHVQLQATSNDAGIELRDAAQATLVNVDCAACVGATVAWDCASMIGNIAVTASEGTPTAMVAPSQCK